MALLKFSGFYTPKLLATNPAKMFLFGDNVRRVGKGGQAAIRDCRNACGVATKMTPTNDPDAFFRDATMHRHIRTVVEDLSYVAVHADRCDIVVPITEDGHISLGLGLAALDVNSPTTYKLICAYLDGLADSHGGYGSLDPK